MPTSPNARAALFMTLAMANFLVNDMLTKYAAQSMNMGQVMLVRGVFASAFITLLAWRNHALTDIRGMLHPWVLVRTLADAVASICFLIALAHTPLVTMAAIQQALPLAVTMGAALFFDEPVGWRRWTAIAVGFLGVMIILRPTGDGLNIYALLALACVFFCMIRDLATRAIPQSVPTLQISVITSVAVMLSGVGLLQPLGGWTPLSTGPVLVLAAAAVLVLIGYQALIAAMRTGDISFTAPFRYTALLWAALLGFFVFGEIPDLPTLTGAVMIIGSGIFTIYRERRRRDAAPVAAEAGPAPRGL